MIYITDSKGNGEPCKNVYIGKRYSWYYCMNNKELFDSLINLLRNDSEFRIFNVYGKQIIIPNNPNDFKIVDYIKEFTGLISDTKNLNYLLKSLIKVSNKIIIRGNKIEVSMKNTINAEEILRYGVRIFKPIILPRLYSNIDNKEKKITNR